MLGRLTFLLVEDAWTFLILYFICLEWRMQTFFSFLWSAKDPYETFINIVRVLHAYTPRHYSKHTNLGLCKMVTKYLRKRRRR
jgi:hypothetical protein